MFGLLIGIPGIGKMQKSSCPRGSRTTINIDFEGQHFQFLPFGSGRRICPGMSLGMAAVELALANLLYRFNWDLSVGMSKEDIDMEEQFHLILHKKSNLLLVATPVPMVA